MGQLVDYKGLLIVSPTPSNLGGEALKDDLEELADRAGPVFETTADPTVDDDSAGTAGNGEFFLWSKWLNTTTAKAFICINATPSAAIWKEITGSGGGGGSPGGANTQLQFNDTGSFGGDPNLTFDKSTGVLAVNGSAAVDNLKLDGNTLSSTDANGDVAITPDGTGNVVLDGLNWPTSDGSANQVLSTDGSANLSWTNAGGGGLTNWDEGTGTYSGQEWASLLPDSGLGTNVLAVIGGKGNLGLSTQAPDGTSTGGNTRGTESICIQGGRLAATQVASGNRAVAIGYGSTASGYGSIAIGRTSTATNQSTAIGFQCTASGDYGTSTAVGYSCTAQDSDATAVGYGCSASSGGSSAFGRVSNASGQESTAVGKSCSTSGLRSSAFGYNCTTSGERALAAGTYAKTTVNNTCEIGYWSGTTTRAGAIRAHSTGMVASTIQNRAAAYTDGGATAGSEADNTVPRECYALRRDGTNVYLDLNVAGTITTKTLGGGGSGGLSNWDEATGTYSGQEWVSLSPGNSLGTNVLACIGGKGNLEGISSHVPDGTSAGGNVRGRNSVCIQGGRSNANQVASGSNSTAVGYGNIASGNNSTAIGYRNTASNTFALSVGYANTASGYYSSALGYQNTASGYYSSALGYLTTASGSDSSAIGHRAKTTVSNTCEVGYWSNSTTRAGAVRIHDTGMVCLTVQDRSTEYSDGGATAGSEANNTLPRSMFTIRRDGLEFFLEYNDAGTVKQFSLGTVS